MRNGRYATTDVVVLCECGHALRDHGYWGILGQQARCWSCACVHFDTQSQDAGGNGHSAGGTSNAWDDAGVIMFAGGFYRITKFWNKNRRCWNTADERSGTVEPQSPQGHYTPKTGVGEGRNNVGIFLGAVAQVGEQNGCYCLWLEMNDATRALVTAMEWPHYIEQRGETWWLQIPYCRELDEWIRDAVDVLAEIRVRRPDFGQIALLE